MESLTKFWPIIYSVIREFWNITEPHIEDAALRDEIPIELYYYSELGMDLFSIENFQKRDPFSNPEQFERVFTRLNLRGWIEPMPDWRYQVTEEARQAARGIIRAGDAKLDGFEAKTDVNLRKLTMLLKQIVTANETAPEPPQKWAILNRFRVADTSSPWIAQIREYLMDLYAYRDDSHLSASHPYFGRAGIAWITLGAIWTGDAITAAKMAETMTFRGYDVEDYEVAVQAAAEIGWIEATGVPGAFRPTQLGKELREQAENMTNAYFYRPWSVMTQKELDELYDLLTKLRDGLREYQRT